jgi:hypothetical protein
VRCLFAVQLATAIIALLTLPAVEATTFTSRLFAGMWIGVSTAG